jgi:ADP-ribose pyrophosphatase
MDYKVKKSEMVHSGKLFDVKVDEIEYEGGETGTREVVLHPGGSVMLPITDQQKIIFISQFRYPLQNTVIELPAGKLSKGEDPQVCAERELEEETGYKAGNVTKLGTILTSPGFCNETLYLYMADSLRKGEAQREAGEKGMMVFELSFEETEKKIVSGEINDSKTICAFFLAKKLLNK